MNISISGKPCSGKTTICEVLRKKYKFKVISSGKLFRQEAKRRKVSVVELNKLAYTDPTIDKKLDERLIELGKKYKGKKIIFDARLAWYFVEESFKVFVDIDLTTAANRLLISGRDEIETGESANDSSKRLLDRWQLENDRYKIKYGVDNLDMTQYDFVINTQDLTAEQSADQIYQAYLNYTKRK